MRGSVSERGSRGGARVHEAREGVEASSVPGVCARVRGNGSRACVADRLGFLVRWAEIEGKGEVQRGSKGGGVWAR
jgi:hypothetical protein